MREPIQIPWPLSSVPGANAQESGGRLVNCTAEPLGQESPLKVAWRRVAGLSKYGLADLTYTPFRGGILVDTTAYVACGTHVVTVDTAGNVAAAGTLAGSDKVTFARNNASPPDIQCVSPANGAFTVTSGSVTSFNGGGNLPTPNSVCAQAGYFFWSIGDNRIFAAGPNSTTVNANTFVTADSRATGNLYRVVPYQGLLWAFASEFCEIYSNTANPFPAFPYSLYAVMDCGLFSRNAIAGWEDGFGILHWVGNGPDGLGVYRANGAQPQKVSPPDLDRLIEAIGDTNADTLEMFCYAVSGRNYITVSSPTWTWELNLNTMKWHERDSLNAGLPQRWRATGPSFHAFGKWLTGDQLSTNLLMIDPTTQQEMGTAIRMRMESGPVLNFPNRTAIARADFNFVTGVGNSSGTTQTAQDPQVSLACSRDGGVHWDNPRLRRLGQEADGRRRVYVTNCGTAGPKGARWRLDISDEVFASFLGATMSADPRAR